MKLLRWWFAAVLCIPAVFGCGSDEGGEMVASGGAGTSGASGCADGEVEVEEGVCIERITCPATIPTFKLGLEAVGDDARYKAVIVDAMPSIPVQRVNRWVVDIVDMDDAPVAEAEVDDVLPFMPAHGHDGLRQPVWQSLDEPGRFDVDVINLWMPGPWTVTFDVTGPDGSDSIVFDVCI